MISVGVLVPIDPERPMPPPEARPIGRAALSLADSEVQVVFGDRLEAGRMTGLVARPGGWEPVGRARVVALHDRYPSQHRAERFAALQREAHGLPWGNPVALTLLCRDKLGCQRFLEAAGVEQPEVEEIPARFEERLRAWGRAFLKPRYGALGIGVTEVRPGDPLPAELPGAVPGRADPAILQWAVPPPAGWAGRSVRVLCQREPDGRWWQSAGVVRQSRTDPVVNAARGAEVVPAEVVLDPEARARMAALCARVCAALSAHPEGGDLLELGVDLVLDGDDLPHLVEVNSRPRGRLEALALAAPHRFHAAHVAACARPLRYLAARYGRAAATAVPQG